jgi:pyrroline-5-carboxylate reductase
MSDLQVAIQGAGHLTAALIEGFFRADLKAISIYNRTTRRAVELAREFPTLRVFDDQSAFDSEKCPLLVVIPGRALLETPSARIERLKASGRVVVSCINGLPLSCLPGGFRVFHGLDYLAFG